MRHGDGVAPQIPFWLSWRAIAFRYSLLNGVGLAEYFLEEPGDCKALPQLPAHY